jgi:hypothetical protein
MLIQNLATTIFHDIAVLGLNFETKQSVIFNFFIFSP